jgi:hypothetical protein
MEANMEAAQPNANPASANLGEYLEKRLLPQIAWYKSRAREGRKRYLTYSMVQLIGAAVVPFFNAYGCEFRVLLYTSSICAILSAIFTGLISIRRPQEDWIRYRHASNVLDGLRSRYQYRVEPFNGPDAEQRLVTLAEEEIMSENAAWKERFDDR